MTEGGPTMKRSHKEDLRLYDLRCMICCAVLVLIAAIRPLHAQRHTARQPFVSYRWSGL